MFDIFVTRHKTKSGKVESTLRWWVSLLLAMALAIGTWNPTEYNFVNFIVHSNPLEGFKPFYILLMFALWVMAIKAVLQSLKIYGAIIAALIIGAFVWGLVQKDLINLHDFKSVGWLASISIGLIIWLGLNASVIWKKLTGVYTTDLTDED
jgi:hypothetical protein